MTNSTSAFGCSQMAVNIRDSIAAIIRKATQAVLEFEEITRQQCSYCDFISRSQKSSYFYYGNNIFMPLFSAGPRPGS